MTTTQNLTDAVYSQDMLEEAITDVGMGLFLALNFGTVIRYVADEDRWIAWNGKCWDWDDKRSTHAMNIALAAIQRKREDIINRNEQRDGERDDILALLAKMESGVRLKQIIDAAARVPAMRCTVDQLDALENEIVCANGVVSLDTGEIRKHEPNDLCTKIIEWDYDAASLDDGQPVEGGLLKQYLDTFMPDPEDQRFVFALLGYSLRLGNEKRWFPIFWGGTTSGKSQLFDTLHKLLGKYICTINAGIFRANLDDKPRPDLVTAMFHRIAYATEASKSWALHGEQIKRLTGNDVLAYRNLFEGVVQKKPHFIPMLVTNEMPRIANADAALKRRIIAVHFDKTLSVDEEDPNIRLRFQVDDQVKKGLLALLVRGAQDYDILANPPERFILATMHAREGLDHVDEFLEWIQGEEWLVKVDEKSGGRSFILGKELFRVYTYWVKKYAETVDKRDVLGLKQFNMALKSREWMDMPAAGMRWKGWGWTPDEVANMELLIAKGGM